MNHPEFSPEGTMINLKPQDFLHAMDGLSEHRTYIRGAGTPRFIRGSGLFKSIDVTPLLISESKETSAPGHWNNFKSSARNAVSRVGQSVKNKVKTPKYDTLEEEDSSETHETDESNEFSEENDMDEESSNQDSEPVNKRKKRSTVHHVANKQVKPLHSESGVQKELVTTGSFSCDICNREFSARTSLTRHTNSIHKEQKFTCPNCNKQCSRLDNLKAHIKSCKQ
jgi:hypothetical protein